MELLATEGKINFYLEWYYYLGPATLVRNVAQPSLVPVNEYATRGNCVYVGGLGSGTSATLAPVVRSRPIKK